jgi:hypothetical protein
MSDDDDDDDSEVTFRSPPKKKKAAPKRKITAKRQTTLMNAGKKGAAAYQKRKAELAAKEAAKQAAAAALMGLVHTAPAPAGRQPRKPRQTSVVKQVDNLAKHARVLAQISTAPVAHRNKILENASQELVQALATAVRLLKEHDIQFVPAHARRAAQMASKNTAARTKKGLVSGKNGKKSKGGGFFSDVAGTALQLAPQLLSML